MAIAPFCTPAVEIAGRAKETQALNDSRPGVDGNVTPPAMPSTGEVPFYQPTNALNPIGEVMNTAGKKPNTPTVIASDDTQRVIE